jgi:hypothetical protein
MNSPRGSHALAIAPPLFREGGRHAANSADDLFAAVIVLVVCRCIFTRRSTKISKARLSPARRKLPILRLAHDVRGQGGCARFLASSRFVARRLHKDVFEYDTPFARRKQGVTAQAADFAAGVSLGASIVTILYFGLATRTFEEDRLRIVWKTMRGHARNIKMIRFAPANLLDNSSRYSAGARRRIYRPDGIHQFLLRRAVCFVLWLSFSTAAFLLVSLAVLLSASLAGVFSGPEVWPELLFA